MARTPQQIEADITANAKLDIMEYVKDYASKLINANTDKLNAILQDVYSHVNGIDVVVGHLGKPLDPAASDPASPNEYDWYFNTTSREFKMYHNSSWTVIATLSSVIDAYTKTESDNRYVRKTNDYKIASFTHQTNIILGAEQSGFSSIADGTILKLDISEINALLTSPNVIEDAAQLFIGTQYPVRIPNSGGTASMKWVSKTNQTDTNVQDNYLIKDLVVEMTTNSGGTKELHFIRWEPKPGIFSINFGVSNAGKELVVGTDGFITMKTQSGGGSTK